MLANATEQTSAASCWLGIKPRMLAKGYSNQATFQALTCALCACLPAEALALLTATEDPNALLLEADGLAPQQCPPNHHQGPTDSQDLTCRTDDMVG